MTLSEEAAPLLGAGMASGEQIPPPPKRWSGPMGCFVPAAGRRPEAAFGTLQSI